MTMTSAPKRKLKYLAISLSLMFLVISFQNFSKVNLAEHPELGDDGVKGKPISELFKKDHSDEDLHIDLIIFLESEISTKNKNIEKEINDFIIRTEKNANLNLAVFSNKNSKNGFTLSGDQLKKGYLQFNNKNDLSNFLKESVKFMPELIKTGFLREKSKKILIVFGKDDFKSGKGEMTNEMFLSQMGAFVDMEQVSMFSFVGLDAELSECATATGVRAIDLASQLRGTAFNICDDSWMNHFQSISSYMARETKNKFLLSTIPSKSISVRVDGVVTDNYSIIGNSIVLNKNHFSEQKSYIIQVDYLAKNQLLTQK